MNLRKDHYRLLVLTDLLTRLTPPRDRDRLRFLLGALTCLSKLSTPCPDVSISCLDVVGQGGPRLLRYRTPDGAAASLGAVHVGCLIRFKELSPQPGFAISPRRDVQLLSQFSLSRRDCVRTRFRKLNNTTLYSGSFGSGVDEERS